MNRRSFATRSILILTALLITPAFAGDFLSASVAPPPVPVEVQPSCPGPGYIWMPGYWLYGEYGYAWVPGQWVYAPSPGMLWTPGYWGLSAGVYIWHAGYWGPRVGFYGGVNYGFGYYGTGFVGGRWEGGSFHYNTAVWNVSGSAFQTYSDRTGVRSLGPVNHNGTVRSANGGTGAHAAANRPATAAARTPHQATKPAQVSHTQNHASSQGANGGGEHAEASHVSSHAAVH
jgi:hypothetical protein